MHPRVSFSSALLGLVVAASCGGGGKYAAQDAKVQRMVTSTKVPIDAQLEGVWNDYTESSIALVYREGDELRVLVAIGDMRPNIPLTSFEVTSMGNHFPGPEERARAADALKTWRDGSKTAPDRFLFAMVGKNSSPDQAAGSWTEGNRDCTTSLRGNFLVEQHKDSAGELVLVAWIYATKQKWGAQGGQDFDFQRNVFFTKSKKPIPPSLLEKLKTTDNFCRQPAA